MMDTFSIYLFIAVPLMVLIIGGGGFLLQRQADHAIKASVDMLESANLAPSSSFSTANINTTTIPTERPVVTGWTFGSVSVTASYSESDEAIAGRIPSTGTIERAESD